MDDNKLRIKPHWSYIANLLYPYLTLLIIPVLRAFYLYFSKESETVSAVVGAEAVMLFVATNVAVLKFQRTRVTFGEEKSIHVLKGLFCKISYKIPKSATKVIVLETNPILSVFGACRLKIYTEAGTKRRADEIIPIRRSDAKRLLESYQIEGETVQSNTYSSIVMSAALSSATAGVLLAIPIVKVAVSLLGKSIPSLLPEIHDNQRLYEWFKLAGKFVPLVIALGYVISFAVLLLRNYKFSSVRTRSYIMLDAGKLPHRTVLLESRSIKAVKTVKAPLMLLANKCAVKFSACGYGRRRGEIGLLVPCVKPQLANGLIGWLVPHMDFKGNTIKTNKKGVRRCIWLPLIILTVALVSATVVSAVFPRLKLPVTAVMLPIFLFCGVWLAVRLYIAKHGSVAFSSEGMWIKYRQSATVNELKCKRDDIESICIRETPFDRRHGHCTLKLRLSDKNRDTATLKYIDKKVIIEQIDYRQIALFVLE